MRNPWFVLARQLQDRRTAPLPPDIAIRLHWDANAVHECRLA